MIRLLWAACLGGLVAGCAHWHARPVAPLNRPLQPACPPVQPGLAVPLQPGFPQPGPVQPQFQPVPQPTPVGAGVSLRKTGPTQGSLGATLVYQIDVANAGTTPARSVVVSDQLTEGLTYLASTPPAATVGTELEWQLGDLQPGATRTIEVRFRADRGGAFNNCAVVRTAEGLTAQDCASTLVAAPGLEVTMRAPSQALVGQEVTFEITVTNRGQVPATGLLITDRFDAGLEHAVSASPIERDLDTLAPGQSRTIGVTFRVTRPGRLCNQVEVTGAPGLRAANELCVEAVAAAPPAQPPVTPPATPPATPPGRSVPPAVPAGQPGVAIKKSGPATCDVGGTAEFKIDITNTGNVPLSNLTVTDTLDPALEPVQATEGHSLVGNDLVWKLPALAVGQSVRLELNTRCQQAAARACNRVRVTTDQGATAQDEACLEIRGVPSELTMTVLDLADPVAVGKDVTYEIRVTNAGRTPDRQLALQAVLPPEMSVVRLGTQGPGTYGVDGQNVRFEPVAELAPGQTLTFRVRAHARQPGEVRFKAILASQGLQEPLVIEEPTTVFANQ